MAAALPTEQQNFGERLRLSVKMAGGVTAVSSEIETGQSTLYTWFNQTSAPPVDKVVRIAELAGVRIAWLVGGELPIRPGESVDQAASPPPEVVDIPVLDIAASAGGGTFTENEQPAGETVPFSRQWLTRQFGNIDGLRLVRVAGDSMEPDLRDKDWLMIDVTRTDLADGLFVVRVDDRMLVKRLQVQGRNVSLASSNPAYPPMPIDLKTVGNDFAIIGRCRWSGKMLG